MSATTNVPSWSPYKAALFDLDNTLIVSNHFLSDLAASALLQLSEAGIAVGLATGKSYYALHKRILPFFPSHSLHIITGGGQIIDHSGTPRWQQAISNTVLAQIVTLLLDHQAAFFMVHEKNIFVSPELVEYLTHHPLKLPFEKISRAENYSSLQRHNSTVSISHQRWSCNLRPHS